MLIQRKLNVIEMVIGGIFSTNYRSCQTWKKLKNVHRSRRKQIHLFSTFRKFFSTIKVDYRHRILLFQVILIALLFVLIIFVWKRFRKIIYQVSKRRQKKF
jgi:dolichol kinase